LNNQLNNTNFYIGKIINRPIIQNNLELIMKKIIALSLLLFGAGLFAQENEQMKMFSAFKIGALAGINFSTLSGGSVILEGKTNLAPNLNLTLSVGYSKINKKAGYNVKTFQHIQFENVNEYETVTYNVDEINYDVFPVSLGIEYYFQHNVFSPYTLFEVGYNGVQFHKIISGSISGVAGSFNTFDQLPDAYKGTAPLISKNNSYRIAVGIGTTYKLTSFLSLDIRYLYQYNKSLENTNQILVGINF
jgi:opacity protein-like surface antigen